jgi:RIO kinase 1
LTSSEAGACQAVLYKHDDKGILTVFFSDNELDAYEALEAKFLGKERSWVERKPHKKKANHKRKQSELNQWQAMTDEAPPSKEEVTTTYKPSRFEGTWLLQSLQSFRDRGLIADVNAMVKGGKEASVYRCAANPSTEFEWVAAKVYRPRAMRQLRNDKQYREGRGLLTNDESVSKASDRRVERAMASKSGFGQQVAHTSWLMHEFTTLQTLHAAGAAVPQPIAVADNAILMEYIGEEHAPAPHLFDVRLQPAQAEALFVEVMRNLDLMLAHGLIHGDLSAYNILYWDGEITLIDFPQITLAAKNSTAYSILERDVLRVCGYFAAQGYARDAKAITRGLWSRYQPRRNTERIADASRYEVDDEA